MRDIEFQVQILGRRLQLSMLGVSASFSKENFFLS